MNINTPCFVIHEDRIDSLINELQSSLLSLWPSAIVGYSFKTNNLPWIIKHMKEKGLYAEVVSSDEYNLARALGYDIDHIIFNGPVKYKPEFIEAIEGGAFVNIDSTRELEWLLECELNKLKSAKIGLRVNFCIEDYCKGESQCGIEDGRFGFSYENGSLESAIKFLIDHDIKISGLHLHCSSKTRSLNIYSALASIAVEIVRKYGLKLSYIDIGGGFFGGVIGKPSFFEYFSVIKQIFEKEPLLNNVCLIVEPGISLVGAAIDYIVSVTDKKTTKNNNFFITDGSRIHIDPFKKRNTYSYQVETCIDKSSNTESTICGFTCMEDDRFFKYSGKDLSIGDKIIFEKVGAYSICLTSQFIEFYPAVYVCNKGKQTLVRRRNTAKDFLLSNLD